MPTRIPLIGARLARIGPGLATAALSARTRLHQLADAPLPAEAVMFELSMGFAVSRMLAAVARLGIADELDRAPATAEQVAGSLGLNAPAVHRVLRALVTYGVVRLDAQGRFRLTRLGRMLRRDSEDSIAPWLLYLDEPSTQDAWARIWQTMIDGEPCFHAVHGVSVWDWLADHPAEQKQFAAGMRRLTEIDLPAIVAAYPWPDPGCVADVAGGTGALLAGILSENPGTTGVLVDHPEVLAAAAGQFERRGLASRAGFTPGDIFTGIDVQAEVYVLKDVLHDWDDDHCEAILRTVRAAAPEGAQVVLVELLQPPNAARFPASLGDVHMLTQTDGGRQRSLAELQDLLRAAGFGPGQVLHTRSAALVTGQAR